MYYRNRAIKTAAAREWEANVLDLLKEHEALIHMANNWKLHGGVFHIGICNNYPRYIYYNKQGQISSKTFDCDNILKPLIDVIFGKFMKVNDKHIVLIRSSKGVGATHGLSIHLSLLPDEQN